MVRPVKAPPRKKRMPSTLPWWSLQRKYRMLWSVNGKSPEPLSTPAPPLMEVFANFADVMDAFDIEEDEPDFSGIVDALVDENEDTRH